MPEFYMIRAVELSEYPDFYDICPKKITKFPNFTRFLCENARILHNNNCPKNSFPEMWGHVPPNPPYPTHMETGAHAVQG